MSLRYSSHSFHKQTLICLLLHPAALYNTALSYHPQPHIYQSQAGFALAGQNKWHSSLASQCSLCILWENCALLLWFGTAMTSFAQGWSGFQNLFSWACHWWCDFSYFKLKPRHLIIKFDSLWGFDVFLLLPCFYFCYVLIFAPCWMPGALLPATICNLIASKF